MSDGPVLLLDNYDSFVFNLFQRIGELSGRTPAVVRSDRIGVEEVRALAPSRIVLSPGPGTPADPARTGVCLRVIQELGPSIPVLGVCLGHQAIGAAFGASVVRAPRVVHGKTSRIFHRGAGALAGLSDPFLAMRYHSLVVDPATVPACLEVTAWTRSGLVMGLRHRDQPTEGVQFHPESVGTPEGLRLLANFLGLGDDPRVGARVAAAAEACRDRLGPEAPEP